MSDSDKPETPPTPPAGPDAVAPPEGTAEKGAAPPQPAVPAKPALPPRSGKRPPPRGGGDFPNRRMREPVKEIDDDYRYGTAPKMKDLDAEIAEELEAAMTDLGQKDLLAADNSRQARDSAAKQPGDGRKQGRVVSVHGGDVFLEVAGGRSPGMLPIDQFPDGPPKIGDMVDVTIEGYDNANGLLILTRQGSAVVADWSTVAEGMVVEARVLETNKGGLSVDVNGIRGFMPISHIDLFRVENAEQYVGQKLLCMVSDVDQAEHNLVVSRRALLEKEREAMREKLWTELAEGQVRTGIVRSVRDFGAFVDLGGVDGLLHVSEMSWKRGADASKLVQPGQSLQVIVLKIDHEKRKLSLSVKQLEAGPWENIHDRFSAGQVVKGTVTRTKEFGAFVELEPGVEGLIHVSELARKRIWRVSDFIKEGQEVEVKILNIDPAQQRISLSLRQAMADDQPVKTPEEGEEESADEAAPAPRTPTPNLRGGIGGQGWSLPQLPE
jgi:small subunit ribosomal protein S1